MKNRLLIVFFGLAIFSFFSFQPPTLHPEIAAAKAWYEANVTGPLAPNWTAAELDIYSNGNVAVSLPVSNFGTHKWTLMNNFDTSQINGTTRIMIGKKPNEPYQASLLRFDFSNSSLLSAGPNALQNIRLKPSTLISMGFNGICYAENMADPSKHSGLFFENGIPTKTVVRKPQDVDSVTDRDCIDILMGYQTNSIVPDPSSSVGSAVYVSWTWWVAYTVCDNFITTNFVYYFPWQLPDEWTNLTGNWNPPPPEPPGCNCLYSLKEVIAGEQGCSSNWSFAAGFVAANVTRVVTGMNCKDGSYSGGSSLIHLASSGLFGNGPGPTANYNISENNCWEVTPPVYIGQCKWNRKIRHRVVFTVYIYAGSSNPQYQRTCDSGNTVDWTIE